MRFSLKMLLLVLTMGCVAAWWWQRPYEVTSTIQLPPNRSPAKSNKQPTMLEGQRVDTMRRDGLDDPVKHGPVRVYDERGTLIFEENWLNGVRHGLYRRWDRESGELASELEFDHGRLIRVGELAVDDFLQHIGQEGGAGRIRNELTKDTVLLYRNQPLSDIVDDIAFRHGIGILIDTPALRMAGVDLQSPISAELRPMPLFAALSATLAPLDLTCIYKFEFLWVTTTDSELNTYDLKLESRDELIHDRLNESTSFSFLDASLADVFGDISDQHNITIVDLSDGHDAGNVTMSLNRVSLHSALGTLCYLQGLAVEGDGGVLTVRPLRSGEDGSGRPVPASDH